MTNRRCLTLPLRRGRALLVCMALAAGCNSTAPPAADTGAKEAVQQYCEALLRRDWARAYAALHPDSRARCSPEVFADLATKYRRDLGVDPGSVHVRFCQELGTRAVAHIVWQGRKAARERFYKDAVVLRQSRQGLGAILPHDFGGGRL